LELAAKFSVFGVLLFNLAAAFQKRGKSHFLAAINAPFSQCGAALFPDIKMRPHSNISTPSHHKHYQQPSQIIFTSQTAPERPARRDVYLV